MLTADKENQPMKTRSAVRGQRPMAQSDDAEERQTMNQDCSPSDTARKGIKQCQPRIVLGDLSDCSDGRMSVWFIFLQLSPTLQTVKFNFQKH